ncbi:MAG: hypothetical protein H0X25_15440 [Acidobacteriales bacterium]|nr:hypothetical protein [Terriglobales bacterium]
MKSVANEIREYFGPVIGASPWKAELGVGSFLTFEFGKRVLEDGHQHGEWHLWISLANWELHHNARKLADSDAHRTVISVAVRRLKQAPLTEVLFDEGKRVTTFVFGDFRLTVAPADYLKDPDSDDDYWLFFMPEKRVMSLGPSGLSVETSDVPQHA